MNWKAYDEVHFSDQYILRWVREGDEYVNRISKEMMEDLQATTRQQADRIAELEKEKQNYKYDPETGEPLIDGYPLYSGLPTPQIKELSDIEISLIAEEFTGADGLDVVDFGRSILKKASEK